MCVPSYNLERWELYLGSFLVTNSLKMGSDSFCPALYLDCNPDRSTFSWGLLLMLTGGFGPDGNMSSSLLKVLEGMDIRHGMSQVGGGLR